MTVTEFDQALATMAADPLDVDEAAHAQEVKRRRGRPRGIPNPNAGRKAIGSGPRRETAVMLDPDRALLVQRHANARGQSVSESINQLIGEAFALGNQLIDGTQAQEVIDGVD